MIIFFEFFFFAQDGLVSEPFFHFLHIANCPYISQAKSCPELCKTVTVGLVTSLGVQQLSLNMFEVVKTCLFEFEPVFLLFNMNSHDFLISECMDIFQSFWIFGHLKDLKDLKLGLLH